MRSLLTGLGVATVLLILAASPASAQQQSATSPPETQLDLVRRELCIAAAASAETDEETWARLVSGYATEKEGFVRLLLDLEVNQIDYAYDSLSDIRGKRAAIGESYHRNLRTIFDRRRNLELEIDYLRVAWEVMPRLTGRIVEVGPDKKLKSLDQALVMLKSGDRVELQAGTYELTLEKRKELPSDVALVGRGSEWTTLVYAGKRHRQEVDRWRFSNVALTCKGSRPFSSGVTPPGSIHVDRCKITGFDHRQGAFAGGGVLLVEDCVADGEADHFGADLFDSHSHRSWLAIYLRRCKFSNIDDLAMHMQAPMIVDRCRFTRPQDRFGRGGPFQQNLVDVRGSNVLLRDAVGIDAQSGKAFTAAVDDKATMQYVLGKQQDFPADVDPRIIELNSQLQLRRNPFYWIGLLRHTDDEVRRTAAAKISELLPVRVVPPELPQTPPQSELAKEIAAAIESLDSDQFAERERVQTKLLRIGKPAVAALRKIAAEGALEQRTRAEQILLELGETASSADRPELTSAWELQYGRVSRWYAEHRRGLVKPN